MRPYYLFPFLFLGCSPKHAISFPNDYKSKWLFISVLWYFEDGVERKAMFEYIKNTSHHDLWIKTNAWLPTGVHSQVTPFHPNQFFNIRKCSVSPDSTSEYRLDVIAFLDSGLTSQVDSITAFVNYEKGVNLRKSR